MLWLRLCCRSQEWTTLHHPPDGGQVRAVLSTSLSGCCTHTHLSVVSLVFLSVTRSLFTDEGISKCASRRSNAAVGPKQKSTLCFFLPPKQPGFVRVCQSCQEEAPVGEAPFPPLRRSFFFDVVQLWIKGSRNLFVGVLQLSNHQFEELAMDVYDEVDRRETDAGGAETEGGGVGAPPPPPPPPPLSERLIYGRFPPQCGWPRRTTARW